VISSNQGEFESRYRTLTDDGLLQLAIEGGLNDQAAAALRVEMQRRSLGSNDVKELKDWEKDQADKQRPAPTPQRVFLGYGVRYIGHKFLSAEDERRKIFVTTKFLVLRNMTVFPIGSYRAQGDEKELTKTLEPLRLQWDQVWQGMKLVVISVAFGFAGAAASIYFAEHRHR
jgi:hypothetical protein